MAIATTLTVVYSAVLFLTAISVYAVTTAILYIREERAYLSLGYASAPGTKGNFLLSVFKFISNVAIINRPLFNLPYFQKLQNQLDVLKINLNIRDLLLIKEVMLIISAVSVALLLKPELHLILISAAVGFFIPDVIYWNKVKAKKENIVRLFPETVDMIDLCIGAGLDFITAMKWVADKTKSNAFVEQLRIVLDEIRVGKSHSQALKDMAKRLNIPDISSFSRSIIMSERMGTSVEEAFKNLSEDTRISRFQKGERYAIKASLKILFPLLFFILPVIMIVVAGPIIVKFTTQGLFPSGSF